MTAALASLDTQFSATVVCPAARVRVEVLTDVARAESVWRRLENDGVATPFQRFDWVAAFLGSQPAETARIAIVSDEKRRPVMILPVTITRRAGCRVATPVGGRHASYAAPVMLPDWQARLGDARDVLIAVGRALHVDGLHVVHAPPFVEGVANPFAQGGRPSPSSAYSLPLGPTPDESLQRGMSGPARKKLRAKERKLAELGDIRLVRPTEEAEIERVLDAFLQFKGRRFAQLGIVDPFADPRVRDFLRRACLTGEAPALELNALVAGDAILAVLGCAVDRRRASCMFIAFDGDHEAARHSPGDVLVSRVIRQQTEHGRAVFDLGVGEAFYKSLFCSQTDDLVDTTVAVTLRGRALAASLGAITGAKRRMKRNTRVMAAVIALRRAVRGRRIDAPCSE